MSKTGEFNKYKRLVETELKKDDTVKLASTRDVEKVSEKVREVLNVFYEDEDPIIQKIGAIFNAIYTQHTSVFMLSIRILNDLLKTDGNLKSNSCHSSHYNMLLYRLQSPNWIKRIREASGNNAALYELIQKDFLDILVEEIGKDVLDAKKEAHIEWYDAQCAKRNKVLDSKAVLEEIDREKSEFTSAKYEEKENEHY